MKFKEIEDELREGERIRRKRLVAYCYAKPCSEGNHSNQHDTRQAKRKAQVKRGDVFCPSCGNALYWQRE